MTADQHTALQRAAAYCRLYMLDEPESAAAILEMVVADGPEALGAFAASLAGFASTVQYTGRGQQPVETPQELLDYFETMSAFHAMRGAS